VVLVEVKVTLELEEMVWEPHKFRRARALVKRGCHVIGRIGQ
jgi:hypothetical protein